MATTSRLTSASWHSRKASALSTLPLSPWRRTNTTPARRSTKPATGHAAEPGLRDEARQAPQRTREDQGIDEAVEVVGDDQDRATLGHAVEVGHLDPAQQQRGREPHEPRDQPSHGRSVLRAGAQVGDVRRSDTRVTMAPSTPPLAAPRPNVAACSRGASQMGRPNEQRGRGASGSRASRTMPRIVGSTASPMWPTRLAGQRSCT